MKTFNDIKIGDFLYICLYEGLDTKIEQYKVVNKQEIDDNALLFTLDNNENYTVGKSERVCNVSTIDGIYTELDTVIIKLESIYRSSVDWLNYLLRSYNEKVDILKNEIVKWKTQNQK